jgi:hypothetical protein
MVQRRGAGRGFTYALLALTGALVLAGPARASGPLRWSAGHIRGVGDMVGVSCPARKLCVAFTRGGKVLVSKRPAGGASTWKAVRGLHIHPNLLNLTSTEIYDVACPSVHLCLTATKGTIVYTTNPLGGASAWHRTTLDPAALDTIAAISCPGVHFCVALDDVPPTSGPSNGTVTVFTATNPTGGAGAWHTGAPITDDTIQGASCPSVSLCVAGGQGSVDWTTGVTDPTSSWQTGMGWTTGSIDTVSCPSVGLCLAVPDLPGMGNNDVFSVNPIAGIWHKTPVATDSMSCPATTLCVGTAFPGEAIWASTHPSGGRHAWHFTHLAGGRNYLRAVSCASTSFCVAVGDSGRFAVGR